MSLFSVLPLEIISQIVSDLTCPFDIGSLRLSCRDNYQYANSFVTRLDPGEMSKFLSPKHCIKVDYILKFTRLEICKFPILVTKIENILQISDLSHLKECDFYTASFFFPPHGVPGVTYDGFYEKTGSSELRYQNQRRLLKHQQRLTYWDRDRDYYGVLNLMISNRSVTVKNYCFRIITEDNSIDIELKNDRVQFRYSGPCLSINNLPDHITRLRYCQMDNIHLKCVSDFLIKFRSVRNLTLPAKISNVHVDIEGFEKILVLVTSIKLKVSIVSDSDLIETAMTSLAIVNDLRNKIFPHIVSARIPISKDNVPSLMEIFPGTTSLVIVSPGDLSDVRCEEIFDRYPNLQCIYVYLKVNPSNKFAKIKYRQPVHLVN